MSQLQTALPSQLEGLRQWLGDPKGGNNFQSGAEFNTYLGEYQSNPELYVCLRNGSSEDDAFTRTIRDYIIGPFHNMFFHRFNLGRIIDPHTGLVSYKDSSIVRLSNIVVTVIASMLPPLTILILNIPSTTTMRIGLTVLFTALFAIVLAYFSKARRVEILAATATYDNLLCALEI
jgi:VIT1/CCC1 family predicted Fe2+/Mn2+ transporter